MLFCSSACFFKAAGSKHTSSSSDYAAWRPIINLFFPLDSSYNNSFNRMLYYILFEMCFLNQSSYMHLPWLFVCIFGQFSIITILAFDHMLHNGWKSPKMSQMNFWILALFTNFCPSLAFLMNFFHSKCKRRSLRSQRMRLFVFSNTGYSY